MAATEDWVRRFHWLRLASWSAQVPLALLTQLKSSVAYLVFLSLAALIESAGTDVYTAWKDRRDRERA